MSSELDWVDQLKVVDLRKRLKELGENTAGKKAVLAERLKAKLGQQGETQEEKTEKKEDEGEKMDVDADVDKEEMILGEEEGEKKTVKTGLNELLGDGTDDLEFDFETEKPNPKKQKTEDTPEKVDQPPVELKAAEGKKPAAKVVPEKATFDDDLVDFGTPQRCGMSFSTAPLQVTGCGVAAEGKEMKTDLPQSGEEMQRSASGADAMEIEAPVVAEEDRTSALRIQNFVRPFTEKAAKEMLAKFGSIEDMWMPGIKTHCYVLYSNVEEAHNAYLGTYNIVWPRSGKRLLSQFVSVEDAKKAIEDGRSRGLYARASGSASYQKNRHPPFVPNSRPPHGNVPPYGALNRSTSKPALSLEDLFFKTQSKPPIYYLPLTDEQVAEKKRQLLEKESQSTKPAEQNAKDS